MFYNLKDKRQMSRKRTMKIR